MDLIHYTIIILLILILMFQISTHRYVSRAERYVNTNMRGTSQRQLMPVMN